jgi:hypothetical protein
MSLSGPRAVISGPELRNWNHFDLGMRCGHDSKLITCVWTRSCMTYVTGIIRLFALGDTTMYRVLLRWEPEP